MKFNPKELNEKSLYPSPTAGDGKVRPNSLKTGEGHGKKSPHKFVKCAQCGFVCDVNKINTRGGSRDGNGGIGPVTKTVTATVNDPQEDGTVKSVSTGWGESDVKSGCPMCGSFNVFGIKS